MAGTRASAAVRMIGMAQQRHVRFGKPEWAVVSILAALAVSAALVATSETFAFWNQRLYEAWTVWAVHYGYFGAFIAALVGNLTVVIVLPYTIVTFFLASAGLNPVFLGVLTGIGAVIGELSGYCIGRFSSGSVERRRPVEYAALKRIVEHRPAVVPALLFTFSLLPFPDDVLFIPLGMLRYSAWKLIVPSLAGKIGAGLAIAFSARLVQGATRLSAVSTALLYQFGTLMLLTILVYAIFKIPWSSVMNRLIRSDRIE
ncbi:MAG: VTT domain-containing protein [Candidatus Kerfeldbacteria bacterium]